METLTSRDNPTLKLLYQLGRERKARAASQLMLCEGLTLLSEALESGVAPSHVVLSQESTLGIDVPPQTRVIYVPEQLIGWLSPLETSQGLLFTTPLPSLTLPDFTKGQFLVLDRLQDPGNVGSIIRTACAMGITGVVLTADCADITNPKTIRATMGTIFRQQVSQGQAADIWNALATSQIPCYTTGMKQEAQQITRAALQHCAVLIGNEGQGLSEYWLTKVPHMLTIPMKGQCESLGAAVAAALVMWEMSKLC